MNPWHGKLIYTYIGRDYEIFKDKLRGEYYAVKIDRIANIAMPISKLFPTIEELVSAIDEYKADFIYP